MAAAAAAARPGETDDLSSLSALDEATLLEELSIRYFKDKIYVNNYGGCGSLTVLWLLTSL